MDSNLRQNTTKTNSFFKMKKQNKEDRLQFSETQNSFLGASGAYQSNSPINSPQRLTGSNFLDLGQDQRDESFDRAVSYGDEVFSDRSREIRLDDINMQMSSNHLFTQSQQKFAKDFGQDQQQVIQRIQNERLQAQGPETDIGRYNHHIQESLSFSDEEQKVKESSMSFQKVQSVKQIYKDSKHLEDLKSQGKISNRSKNNNIYSQSSQIQNGSIQFDLDNSADLYLEALPNINLKQTSTDGNQVQLLFNNESRIARQKLIKENRAQQKPLNLQADVQILKEASQKHQSDSLMPPLSRQIASTKFQREAKQEGLEDLNMQIRNAEAYQAEESDVEQSVVLDSGLASQQFNTLENTQLLNIPILAQPVRDNTQKNQSSSNQLSLLGLPNDLSEHFSQSTGLNRQDNMSRRLSSNLRESMKLDQKLRSAIRQKSSLQRPSSASKARSNVHYEGSDFVIAEGGLRIQNFQLGKLKEQNKKKLEEEEKNVSGKSNIFGLNPIRDASFNNVSQIDEVNEEDDEKEPISRLKNTLKSGIQKNMKQISFKKSKTDLQMFQASTLKLDELTDYYSESSSFHSDDEWYEDQIRKDAQREGRLAGEQQLRVQDTLEDEEEEKFQSFNIPRGRGNQPNLNLYNSQKRQPRAFDKQKLIAMMRNQPLGKSDSEIFKQSKYSLASGIGKSAQKQNNNVISSILNLQIPEVENLDEEEDEQDQTNNTLAHVNTMTNFNANNNSLGVLNRVPTRQQTQRGQNYQQIGQQQQISRSVTINQQSQAQVQVIEPEDEVYGEDLESDEDGLVRVDQDILDETIFNEDDKKQRRKFFQDFISAKNMIVPTSQGEVDELLDNESDHQNNPNIMHIDIESDNSTKSQQDEQGYVPKQMRTLLQKHNSQGLNVLSPLSWFVHEQIFYSIELRPGVEKKSFYGTNQELESYILDNQELFKHQKNSYAELKQFQEYNILHQQLDTDYEKELKFKGNFQLALYQLPDFTLIKTINLPIFYLHRSSMLTVSSPSNFQIYTSRCVYFIQLHGYFDTYNFSKDYNRDPHLKLAQETIDDRKISVDIKRHYEEVSFQIVIYFSQQDQIIMAAQLGNKIQGKREQQDRKIRRIIFTQECWMDTFTLPQIFSYLTTEDESTNLQIVKCWIANERTIILKSKDDLLYTLGRDQEKLVPLHIGKKQMQQSYKLRMDKTNSDKMNKKETQDFTILDERIDSDFADKNTDHITLNTKQSERMHVNNVTVCCLDLDNNVNNSYVTFQIYLDGSHDRISFGKVKDVQFLKVIENFRENKDPGFKKSANQMAMTINFWSIKTREVFTFDLNEMKLIPYKFFQGKLFKIKTSLIFNAGAGSGNEHILDKEFQDYMIVSYKRDRKTGYVVRSLALKKQIKDIPELLTLYGTSISQKDQNNDSFHYTSPEFLSYLSLRSTYGSKSDQSNNQSSIIQRQKAKLFQQFQKAKKKRRMMFSLNKHSSMYQSSMNVNNLQNQGAFTRFFTRVFTVNNNQAQNIGNAAPNNGMNPIQLARQQSKIIKKKRKQHLLALKQTPIKQIFDSEVELLNKLRYQMCKGRVQELFQQRVLYQHFNDKWNTVEDLTYHQIIKCSKEFIWRGFAEKNYIVFYRYSRNFFGRKFQKSSNQQAPNLKSQKTNQSLVIRDKQLQNISQENKENKEEEDIQVQIIKLKRGCQIREVHLNAELNHVIVIYQTQDKNQENYFRRSIILSLKDLSKPCCSLSIQNIKSIVKFGEQEIILLTKKLPLAKDKQAAQQSMASQPSLPSQPTPTQKQWFKALLQKPKQKNKEKNGQNERELTFLKSFKYEFEENKNSINFNQNVLQDKDSFTFTDSDQQDITDILRQPNFQKKFDYYTHKPRSLFHLIYNQRYILINCDFSYYLIIEKAFDPDLKEYYYQYLGSFEILDKHLYLKFDNNCLYLLNIPSTDSRHKIQKPIRFNDGFLETILRHAVQKLHLVVDLQREKIIIQDSEYQEVAHVRLNFDQRQPTQIIHSQNQFDELTNDHELVKQIQEQMTVEQLVAHYDTYNASFLHQVYKRSPKVLETISKKLASAQIGQISRTLPFLFVKDSEHSSVLDIAVQSQEIVKINIILDMMMRFHNSIHLNELVDPHVNYMLKHKFNLREYFESELPMARIQNMNYPNYSKDSSTIIYGEFDDNNTLDFIWNNYANYLGTKINEKSEDGQVQVEYFFVNMSHTISQREFMINLSNVTDLEVYESLPIKTIIDYKWDVYAEKAAFLQFLIYLVFLLCYSVDIYLLICQGQKILEETTDDQNTENNSGGGQENQDNLSGDNQGLIDGGQLRMLQGYFDGRNDGARIVPKIFCLIYILLMEIYELKLFLSTGWRNYLKDAWNISDQLFALNYIVCIGVDWHQGPSNALTILQSIMCALVFIKACSNLRVFKGFSFQMSMLKAVFFDIRYFILLYTFVITMYGFIFSLLGILPDEENLYYEGISYFGYIIMAFKASVGDTQTDLFYMLSDDLILFSWLVWISAVLFLQVIMLNFIIAVIGESYDKVMQRMMAEAYRVKALLIKERESFFTPDDFNNTQLKDNKSRPYFPRYLILRRPVFHDGDQDVDWQGFVRDLKKTISKAEQNQMDSMRTSNQLLRSLIFDKLETLKKEMHLRQEGLENQVKNQISEIRAQQDDNIQQLAVLDSKMNIILKNQEEQRKQRIYEERRYNQDIKPLFNLLRGVREISSPFQRQSTFASPSLPYQLELNNQVKSAQVIGQRNDLLRDQHDFSPERITQFDMPESYYIQNSKLQIKRPLRSRKQTEQYPEHPLEEFKTADHISLNQYRSQVQSLQLKDSQRKSLHKLSSNPGFREINITDEELLPQDPGYSVLQHRLTLNTHPSELMQSLSNSTFALQAVQSAMTGAMARFGSQLPYSGRQNSRVTQNGVPLNSNIDEGAQEANPGEQTEINQVDEAQEDDECSKTE